MQSPLHRGGTWRQSNNVHAGSAIYNAGRARHLWQCPVAQRVIAVVDSEPAIFANQQAGHQIIFKATDIWLGKHPAGVRPCVPRSLWHAACLHGNDSCNGIRGTPDEPLAAWKQPS